MAYTKRAMGPRRGDSPARAALDHPPVDRLRRFGAPAHVLEEVNRRWASLDEADRANSVTMIETSTDDEIREGIAGMEVSFAGGEDVDDDLVEEAGEILLEGVPDGTVTEVEEWVGEAPARALAALAAELRRPRGDQRKTLLEALRRRVG